MNCFIVSTPYHLIVAAALKEDGDCVWIENNEWVKDSYIKSIIKKYFNNNYKIIIKYKELIKKPYKVREIKNIIKVNNFNKIYAFNDSDPIVQYVFFECRKNSEKIILEEGIGLYNNIHNRKYLIKKTIGKLILGNWYQVIDRIGTYKYTETIYPKNDQYLNDNQKKKKILKYDYDSVKEIIRKENMCNIDKKIWFIGQPLAEDGICTKKEYMDFVFKIINLLGKDNVILKIHPREEVQKYENYKDKINIFSNSIIPFEMLVYGVSDLKLLTITSSSLINCSDDKNTKKYFLYKLFNQINIFPEKLIENRNDIKIIENWKELEREFYEK